PVRVGGGHLEQVVDPRDEIAGVFGRVRLGTAERHVDRTRGRVHEVVQHRVFCRGGERPQQAPAARAERQLAARAQRVAMAGEGRRRPARGRAAGRWGGGRGGAPRGGTGAPRARRSAPPPPMPWPASEKSSSGPLVANVRPWRSASSHSPLASGPSGTEAYTRLRPTGPRRMA